MAKVTQLKNLKITDVSSVDAGAGRGVKVMLMKRDDPEPPKLPMLDDLVDAVMSVQKLDRPAAFVKVMGTLAGTEAYQREREARLMKATAPMVHHDAGDGKPDIPDDEPEGDLESMVQNHMATCKSCNSKSQSYDHILRTDEGKAALRRAKVTKSAPLSGPYGHGNVTTSGNRFTAPGDSGDKTDRDGIRPGLDGATRLQQIVDAQKAFRLAVEKIMADSGVSRSKAVLMFYSTPEGRASIAAERYGQIGV